MINSLLGKTQFLVLYCKSRLKYFAILDPADECNKYFIKCILNNNTVANMAVASMHCLKFIFKK